MNKTRQALLVALATSFALPTLAEEQSPIIVTATKTAQTIDESLATVMIISREDIESSQAISLTEVLRKHAGIHVTTQGGIGKAQTVFIRGTEAGHMLVLIDGVRASSATLGQFSWETISAEQVEKIELVYGPRASLYGSDAIGGVINISTRRSDKTTANVSYGSYNTKQINIATGGGENWKYSLSAGSLTSDGFPTRENDTDDFGHKRNHITATLKNNISKNTTFDASINYSQGSNEHDISTGDSKFKNQVISTTINNAINNSWNQKLLVGHSIDKYTSLSPTTPSTITTTRQSASWQHDIFISKHTTTAGIDYWQDHATKDNSGLIDKTINNAAIFLQQQWNGKSDDFIINIRSDKHSEFGNQLTGSLAWGHNIDNNRLVISYGTAFKAPSVNDLFWPHSSSVYLGTTYITQGNSNLRPETSNNIEISWRTKPTKNLIWNTNIYNTQIIDLIGWNGTLTAPSEYTYVPTNLNSVSINGLETIISYKINEWQLDANVNFLNAKNTETNKQLDRRPEQSINTTITRHVENKQYSLEITSLSERNDRGATVTLDSYMLFNFLFSHDVSKSLKWNFRIDNITKTEYSLAESPSGKYRTPGRNAYVGLNYTF